MALSGKKTPALMILAGMGKPGPAGKRESADMDDETLSETGDDDHDMARKNLKKMSGWDDDTLDALREYVKTCAVDIGETKKGSDDYGDGDGD